MSRAEKTGHELIFFLLSVLMNRKELAIAFWEFENVYKLTDGEYVCNLFCFYFVLQFQLIFINFYLLPFTRKWQFYTIFTTTLIQDTLGLALLASLLLMKLSDSTIIKEKKKELDASSKFANDLLSITCYDELTMWSQTIIAIPILWQMLKRIQF